jgi:hypothetical protein
MKEQLKNMLLFLSLIMMVISCDQKKNSGDSGSITYDSSYAVIPHDTSNKYYMNRVNAMFGKDLKAILLTREDFITIDSLFNACVVDYNNSEKDNRFKIDLSKTFYWKQIIAVINNRGEKEVLVNCLCDAYDLQKLTQTDWKTQIMMGKGGGNCYFNFKINLSVKKYFDLSVNGEV